MNLDNIALLTAWMEFSHVCACVCVCVCASVSLHDRRDRDIRYNTHQHYGGTLNFVETYT